MRIANETKVFHVLYGEADICPGDRRVRFAAWHIGDFGDDAAAVWTTTRSSPIRGRHSHSPCPSSAVQRQATVDPRPRGWPSRSAGQAVTKSNDKPVNIPLTDLKNSAGIIFTSEKFRLHPLGRVRR